MNPQKRSDTHPRAFQPETYARAIFLGAIVLIPLFYFRITVESYVALKEVLISAAALALAAIAFFALQDKKELSLKWCALDAAIIFYLLFSLVSITLSLNKHESFLAWTQLPAIAILYFYVSRILSKDSAALSLFIAAAASLVSIFTICASIFLWFRLGQSGEALMQKLKGFLEIPLGGNNFTAAYLALAFPFTVSIPDGLNKKILFFKYTSLCIQSAALVACLSRTAMASLGVFSLAWLLYSAWKKVLSKQGRSIAAAAAGIAISLLGFFIVTGNVNSRKVAKELMISPGDGVKQGIDSMHMRLFWWKDTVHLIKENPIGVGYGGFAYAFPRYRTIPERFIFPETRLTTPHNDYLHVASEMGYAGIALWLFILGLGFYGVFLGLRKNPESPSALAAGGVLFVALLYSIVDFPLQMPASRVLFFIALALSASCVLENGRVRSIQITKSANARAAVVIVFGIMVWMNVQWGKSFLAQVHVLKEVKLQNEPFKSLEEFYKAIQLDPKARFAYPFAGTDYDKLGEWNTAVKMFQTAVELDPNDYNSINFMGVSLAHGGRPVEAAGQFKKAADIYPAFASPHLNMGILYLQQGMRDKAAQSFRKALELNDQIVEVYIELASLESREGNKKAAAILLSRALEIDPVNQQVKMELSRLHEKLIPGGISAKARAKNGEKQ